MKKISYTIAAKDPATHMFQVSMTIEAPAPEGQALVLPAWIPGSYMIREFARNIVRITALADGRKLGLAKLDKHTWQAAPSPGPIASSSGRNRPGRCSG